MPRVFEGGVSAEGKKFAIVVSQFNQAVTKRLLDGAVDCLKKHGVDAENNIEIFFCPGAFEIPAVAMKITETGGYDAVVCLGAIVRGETPHFEYIAAECARGVASVARKRNVPVLFGVLTTDTYEQAMERSGGAVGNKGWDAALGAVMMANLYTQLTHKTTRN
ncbi:MAG TPA: 6,7-dimethyl-8-ribityllumazine synthase [Bacteroidota bacterium]|nr:6,7-dimethyl-8-ribityllumazine synthase [Bacteroidota bacterium]